MRDGVGAAPLMAWLMDRPVETSFSGARLGPGAAVKAVGRLLLTTVKARGASPGHSRRGGSVQAQALPGPGSREDLRARGSRAWAGLGSPAAWGTAWGAPVEDGMCPQQGVTRPCLPGVWAPLGAEREGNSEAAGMPGWVGGSEQGALWLWKQMEQWGALPPPRGLTPPGPELWRRRCSCPGPTNPK